ncbi:MAG: lipopolysaccharide kinase InaA family protein [Planctomycetota bacterium]
MTLPLPERFSRFESAPGWQPPAGGLAESLRQALEGGRLVKQEPGTLIVCSPLPGGGEAWWKLYRVSVRRRPWTLGIRSRAWREWQGLRAMASRNLRVAPPLAFAEDRRSGFLHSSLLVTRGLEGARDLRELLADPDRTSFEREVWLRAAGACTRAMHDTGFGHFRLQLRNLLALPDEAGAELALLDAPYACAFPGPAPRAVRRIDLIDLAGPRSGLKIEESRLVLQAYANRETPPLELHALRSRSSWRQKIARIALYLLLVNTGHRPAGNS